MHSASNIFGHSATTIGDFWVSLNYPILNFKKTVCTKDAWMRHCVNLLTLTYGPPTPLIKFDKRFLPGVFIGFSSVRGDRSPAGGRVFTTWGMRGSPSPIAKYMLIPPPGKIPLTIFLFLLPQRFIPPN